MRTKRTRGSREPSRGQALVEFALVLPVIVLVIFALFDLGRAVFTYNTLSQSARQAARTAIVNQNTSAVESVAFSSGATLGLSTTDVDVCFKTDTSTVRTCNSTDACTTVVVGCLALVIAHVDYTPMTPIIGNLIGTIPLSSTSIEPIESVCPSATRTVCS